MPRRTWPSNKQGGPVFRAAPFTITKTWEQPKCLSTDEWMKKMWSIHTMKYLPCFCSVSQLCLTLCDPMDCSMPGFPALHHLLELHQTHVHWVGEAIQPSYPLSSTYPPAFNLSQHQGLSFLVSRFLEWGGQSNGILLGLKKEWKSAICSNMDGPRDDHTKWSQSETER